MKCHAYCLTYSYDLVTILTTYKDEWQMRLVGNVLCVQPYTIGEDVFIFSYGVVVFWNIMTDDRKEFLDKLQPFMGRLVSDVEQDVFDITLTKDINNEGHIYLPNYEQKTKLTASFAFAQSVKLGSFEAALNNTFYANCRLPEELAKRGKIKLSNRDIRKKMGQLLLERSAINLHSDIIGKPDFLWYHPELEEIYETVSADLEIDHRGKLLNQKLDIIKELYDMLANELHHQHSTKLEWTVIILIVIEVVLSLWNQLFTS